VPRKLATQLTKRGNVGPRASREPTPIIERLLSSPPPCSPPDLASAKVARESRLAARLVCALHRSQEGTAVIFITLSSEITDDRKMCNLRARARARRG